MREQRALVLTAGIVAALIGAGALVTATMATRLCGKPLPACQRSRTLSALCTELQQYLCSGPTTVQ